MGFLFKMYTSADLSEKNNVILELLPQTIAST